MKDFMERQPIIFEIILFIVALVASVAIAIALTAIGVPREMSSLCGSVGRIIIGAVMFIVFMHCFKGNKPFAGIIYALPLLLVVIWNIASNVLSGMSFTGFTADMFVVGIAPAIFEEVLFRGIFIHNLEKNGKSPMAVMIISALVFGLVHLTNLGDGNLVNIAIQIIYATVLGLLFTAIYIRSKDIISLIIMHAIIDLSTQPFSGEGTNAPDYLIYLFILLWIVEVVFAFLILPKNTVNKTEAKE